MHRFAPQKRNVHRRSAMTRPFLKRLSEKLETALTAAAFAEESELDTARQMLARPPELDTSRDPSRR
jgi:hypothetical protein